MRRLLVQRLVSLTSYMQVFVVVYSMLSLSVVGYSVTLLAQKIITKAHPHINTHKKGTDAGMWRLTELLTQSQLAILLPHGASPLRGSSMRTARSLLLGRSSLCSGSVRTAHLCPCALLILPSLSPSLSLSHTVGAGIFTGVEGWDYGDSVYFCYVTLCTIGTALLPVG